MPSIDSNIYQTKTCPVSRTEFTITDTDIQFLEKVSPVINEKKYQIPVPTLCPPERQRRRLAWRNERNLYKRTCDLSGKELISNVAPHHPFPVYEKKLWFGDDYDPSNFGRNFNFDKV